MTTDSRGGKIRFVDFEADLAAGELFRLGKRVPLQRKPFQVLEILLRSAGAVIPRDQIYDLVWPRVHVDKQRCLNVAIGKLRTALGDSADNPKLVETVGDRGYRLVVPRWEIKLAVLPFQNLSGAEDYLSYGLTEQMIARLGRIHPRLSVMAPASVMYYEGSSKEPTEVGRELNSDYLLCGTVLRSEDCFRITAKLIQVRDCLCLWAESYEREAAGIFAIQDEIAQHIEKAILHTLSIPVARGPNLTTDPTTYEQFLKAGYFLSKWNGPAFAKAIGLCREVIANDPCFAPAYASLAMMFVGAQHIGAMSPKEAYEQVHTLASQALTLSPDLPDAHVYLGFEYALYRADFDAAKAAFSRGIELNPSCVLGHAGYSMVHVTLGRYEEALPAMRRARDLDPLSHLVNVQLGWVLYYAGRMQEALEQARVAIELDQNFLLAHIVAGFVLSALRDYDGAIDAHRRAVQCSPESSLARLALSHSLAVAGQQSEARNELQIALEARSKGRWASPCRIALVHTALNEFDAAMSWLEVAMDERDSWRALLAPDPHFSALADDARFQRLLRRLGSPEIESFQVSQFHKPARA